QAEAFDDHLPRRADRVAVAAAGLDLTAAAAFDGVVGSQDDRPVLGDEEADDQPQEDATGHAGRPRRAVEGAVVVGEVGLVAFAHDAQGGGDGSWAFGEPGADDEDLPPHSWPKSSGPDQGIPGSP